MSEKKIFSKPSLLYLVLGILGIVALFLVARFLYYQGKQGIEIVSMDPLGEVSQKTNFTIEFSREMVADDQVDTALDSMPVIFTPHIPGRYKWISRRRLRFYPDVPLRPATEYSVEVLPEICAAQDFYLEGERKFNFYTERLKINQCLFNILYSGAKMAQFQIETTLQFNGPVDPEQLKSYLTIHRDEKALGPEIDYQLETHEISENIVVVTKALDRLKEEQYFSVRVKNGLMGVGGSLGLLDDFIQPKKVGAPEPVKLTTIYPNSDETGSWIILKFSTPVTAEAAQGFIEVDPKVAFKIEQSGNYLNLKGAFRPGRTYAVTIKKGLVAQNMSTLEKNLTQQVAIENLEPIVQFVDQGNYLTRKGNQKVGIKTINIKNIEVEIFKVFENNLVHLLHQNSLTEEYYYYYDTYSMRQFGQKIYSEELNVQSRLNEPIITAVDLNHYINTERRGIFRVTVSDLEEHWRSSSKWVIDTDLGLLAHKGDDELLVWVNSLSSLASLSDVKVTLYSQSNQEIAAGTTGPDGIVKIVNLKKKMEDFEPYLITATAGNDLSFLKFSDCELSTTDFDVAGRPPLTEGYEASLYTDRGVYRPSETVHLVAVVRNKNVAIPPEFPIKLEIYSPDDRLFHEFRSKVGPGGAAEFEVHVPVYALTGKYLAKLMLTEEQELGRQSFNIEEFIPDRIKVTIKADKSAYQLGEEAAATVKAVNLFGPPAAGRKVEATCEIKAQAFSPEKYRSFTFADQTRSFENLEIKATDATLDTAGTHEFVFQLPTGIRPPGSLKGVISATVLEPGGRAVSAYTAVDVHPYPLYLGLRQEGEGYAQVNQEMSIKYVALNTEGQLTKPGKLQVQINKLIWNSILKRDYDGRYRYVSEYTEKTVQTLDLAGNEAEGTIRFKPDDYGEYRVRIIHPASQARSSIRFYASGWGYAPWSMAHPDRMEIEFEKQNYNVGETAKAIIKAPFSGKLLIFLEREGILETQTLTMKENTAQLEIPVKDAFKPNIYLTCTLIRSIQSLEKHSPVRAFGTAPLMVNCKREMLNVQLETVSEMRPQNTLEVDIRATGTSANAYVTIAAIDEGICQLTDFKTPDLHGFFYAKKRLQVTPYDIYNYILPELEVAGSNSSTAGDRLADVQKKHLTPVDATRVKPVALWVGLTPLGTNGRAKVKFQVPEFNGSLRLMAVAFDGAKLGNATQNVIVREPVVITPTFPRFVAPKDQFQVPVLLFNGTGKEAEFKVNLEVTGPVEISGAKDQSVSLKNKAEGGVNYKIVTKNQTGKATFKIKVKGGGQTVSTTTELPVRPPAPPVSITGSGSFEAAKPVILKLPSNWIPGTEDYQLTTSGFPAVQFTGSLQYLLQYPYGCIEQTTSRVFPLLYFKDIAKVASPELFKNNTAEYYVEEGISRLAGMQLASGGFAYWPGGDQVTEWGSIYAAHFLMEARKAGYSVPERVYRKSISFLKNRARKSAENVDAELDLRSYALYALSVAGQPDKSSMNYMKNNELNKISASGRFLVAGAFGLAGDTQTATELLPVSIQPQSVERETGGTFNSSIRTNAIVLSVLAEIAPKNSSVPILVKWLASKAEAGRWYNTQENAWAFLAIGKALKANRDAQFTGQIEINNQSFKSFTTENAVFTQKEIGGKNLKLSIQGTGTCYYYWQASGIPVDANIPEKDNGVVIRRTYLTRDGKAINYQQIKQGDLIVAEIKMKALDKQLENVIIADLLPGGLEIENPRLESHADVSWIQNENFYPDYMDIRDDRLLLFVNLPEQREVTFYYAMRAVTVGNFVLPPIKGEAMYNPVYSSISSSGMIRVVPMQ